MRDYSDHVVLGMDANKDVRRGQVLDVLLEEVRMLEGIIVKV